MNLGLSILFYDHDVLCKKAPNGRRYRQGRELAGKATRRRIRRWELNPESVGESPHLSGARGVGQVLQDGFEFELGQYYLSGPQLFMIRS